MTAAPLPDPGDATPPAAPMALQDTRGAFLQRARGAGVVPAGMLRHGPLRLDAESYGLWVGDTQVELSPRQIELLAVFLAAPRQVWSREQLHWICWGDEAVSRRVDVQLCRIRGRLRLPLFRNVRDRGWMLRAL